MPRRCVGCPQTEALSQWRTVPHPNGSPSTKLDLQHDGLKRTLDALATSPSRIHIQYGLQTRCIAPLARLSVACLHGGPYRRYPRRYTLPGIGRDGQRLKDGELHGYRHTRIGGGCQSCRGTTNGRLLCQDVHSGGTRNCKGLFPQRASRSVLPDAARQL